MTWISGTIDGGSTHVINAFGGLTIDGGTTKRLTTRTLNHGDGTNPSTALWSGGFFFMQGGSTINNRANATFETNVDGTLAESSGSVFNNAGTFLKSAGLGTTTVQPVFNNTGTVRAKSGNIVFSGNFTQTAGALLLDGGGISKSGEALNIQGGMVGGSGAINGSLILGPTAQLLPGSSPGILTIGGNFQLSGGRVVLEIGGTVPGVDYDQLIITGAFQYTSGVIELVFIGGFVPQDGQTFQVMDSGSTSGTPQFVVKGLEPGWEFSAVRDPVTGVLTVESLNDGVAERKLEISAYVFSEPPSELLGKTVSITGRGRSGSQVNLEASDTLLDWQTIATATIAQDGTVLIVTHDEEATERRFYRLASP